MKSKIIIFVLIVICLPIGFAFETTAAEANWLWPVSGSTTVSQNYSGNHDGIDITAGSSLPIVASKSGTVTRVYSGCNNTNGYYSGCSSKGGCNPNSGYYSALNGTCNYGYGNGLIIDHGDGTFSHYAHMATVSVGNGAYVTQGKQIGTMGSTGYSSGRHLHFSLSTNAYSSGRYNNNEGVVSYIYSLSTQAPSVTLNTDYWRYSIGKTNAVVCGTINNPNRGTISTVGCYLYDKNGKHLYTHIEHCNSEYINSASVPLWTDFNVDANYTLTQGTTYKYVLYAYIDNIIYKSEMASFTTDGSPQATTKTTQNNTTKATIKTTVTTKEPKAGMPIQTNNTMADNISGNAAAVKSSVSIAVKTNIAATTKSDSAQINKSTDRYEEAVADVYSLSESDNISDEAADAQQATSFAEEKTDDEVVPEAVEDESSNMPFIITIVGLCLIVLAVVAFVVLLIIKLRRDKTLFKKKA